MLPIPQDLQARFEEHLAKKLIPKGLHGIYKKWIRYYLDFCHKYRFPPTYTQSLRRFIKKLQEKKQTNAQQEQGTNAIKLYYDTILAKSPSKPELLIQRGPTPQTPAFFLKIKSVGIPACTTSSLNRSMKPSICLPPVTALLNP